MSWVYEVDRAPPPGQCARSTWPRPTRIGAFAAAIGRCEPDDPDTEAVTGGAKPLEPPTPTGSPAEIPTVVIRVILR